MISLQYIYFFCKYTLLIQLYEEVKFSKTGIWCLFYDKDNLAAAWQKLKGLYLGDQLPGVIKISCAKVERTPGFGVPIFAFVGPSDDEHHCTSVGKMLVEKLGHTKQNCNFAYSEKIYFKSKKGGPVLYSVSYAKQ
jgi:hypothetical protein